MRLVGDVFIPFPAFPIAARSTVSAFLFYFSLGRVKNEICPGPLFFGLHKQLILAVALFFELYFFSGDLTEAMPGAGVFGIWLAAWIWGLNKIV